MYNCTYIHVNAQPSFIKKPMRRNDDFKKPKRGRVMPIRKEKRELPFFWMRMWLRGSEARSKRPVAANYQTLINDALRQHIAHVHEALARENTPTCDSGRDAACQLTAGAASRNAFEQTNIKSFLSPPRSRPANRAGLRSPPTRAPSLRRYAPAPAPPASCRSAWWCGDGRPAIPLRPATPHCAQS